MRIRKSKVKKRWSEYIIIEKIAWDSNIVYSWSIILLLNTSWKQQ